MEGQGASSRLTRSDALPHHHGSDAVSPSCFTHVDSLKGNCAATRGADGEEVERKAEPSDFAVVVPLLQRTRRQRLPPPSFAFAPAVPLPLWQRVAISALTARQESLTEQRNFRNIRQNVARELTRYHVELRERAERQRQQQRETRARAGERVAAAVQKYWSRRGDSYQQLMKVEFDVVKHQHDRRKQEDLLRETEALTRKLLESFFAAAGKDAKGAAAAAEEEETEARPRSGSESSAAAASDMKVRNASRMPSSSTPPVDSSGASFWAKVGDDDDTPIERALSLLDTEHGQRPLRHYQRSSLRWMVHLYENNLNGILADEMGLGKTVQTIALLCYYAEYRNDWGPHLIVVPTTVVLNWKAELDRWAPGLKVITYIGSAKEREQLRRGWTSEDAFHVCITSYNLIVQDRKVFRRRPWGFLVLDEAHQVKNFMSLKWQSLFDLQAEYRLLLTGTPLQNSIMELWSLFHFLLPFASAFRSNADFKEWFSNPMDAMITGRSSLNEDIVRRLQALLRPFMLRRLKKDVESQLPTKTEKVVLCHLSRRQRSLYDDYMQLADTRQKLRGGGGAGGVFSVLLALRKVCDHPDLFEERPTLSPFVLGYEALLEVAVPRAALLLGNTAAVAEARPTRERIPCFYVVDVNADEASAAERTEERGVQQQQRLRCSSSTSDLSSYYQPTSLPFLSAASDAPLPWWAVQCLVDLPAATSGTDMADFAARFHPDLFWQPTKSKETHASGAKSASNGKTEPQPLSRCHSSTLQAAFLGVLRSSAKASAVRARQMTAAQQQRHRAMQCARNVHVAAPCALELRQTRLARSFPALCPTVSARAAALFPLVEKVCVYVPAVLAPRAPRLRWRQPIAHTLPFKALDWEACAPLVGAVAKRQDALLCGREAPRPRYDGAFFLRELWPIQVRRSFGFPDKRLLIHDCGKLQFLDVALKEMRQEGHRVLIFTQFVNMLNILERFLALIGVAYLRLDGSTRAEVRQQLVDRFNADARLTCMILSTRSGGVGLNLTGADTVIFYDSDWNPTMDLQAQDRCHRIGQTRPVTIYRLISEHTVEESILRKARERKKLNNVVIRGGQFHSIAGVSENYEDSAAAFAALSDPVNLRSFFHDLDEDATVAAGLAALSASGNVDGGDAAAVSTSGLSMLEEMAKVEDEEDRRAGQDAARELAEREAEDAASESDGDDDINDPTRKRARLEGGSSGGAARAQLSSTGERREESEDDDLWTRKGPNTLRDLYLLPHLVGAAAPAPDATESTTGDDADATVVAGNDRAVCVAVRKRQREMVCKLALPVDQLLTLQYGRCQRNDAEARYDALVDTYTAQMDDMDLLEDEEEEGEEEGRGVEARLPRFRASYHLGSR